MFRKSIILGAIVALGVGLTSCDSDHIERSRSVVEVVSVAENGVFVCGIWDAGSDREFPTDDDFQPAGHVPITLKNRPYNEFVSSTEFSPYGQFHVTEVSVQWEAAHPSTPVDRLAPFNYTARYDVAIPIESEVTFNVMVAPFTLKTDQYFLNLTGVPSRGGDGSTAPFNAVAHITLTGHDSGAPDEPRTIEGSVLVEFIGVIVDES